MRMLPVKRKMKNDFRLNEIRPSRPSTILQTLYASTPTSILASSSFIMIIIVVVITVMVDVSHTESNGFATDSPSSFGFSNSESGGGGGVTAETRRTFFSFEMSS